jgi:hypothetical protein
MGSLSGHRNNGSADAILPDEIRHLVNRQYGNGCLPACHLQVMNKINFFKLINL